MKHKLLICFTLFVMLLTGCTNSSGFHVFKKPETRLVRQNTPIKTDDSSLGSEGYIRKIGAIAEKSGNKAALQRIMADVEKNSTEIYNGSGNTLGLYKLISKLIGKIGHIDKRTHYFRNELNRSPESLDAMLKLNSSLPPSQRWKLVPVGSSLYHMQGKDGIYNLKFVSANGFCEAVYNKRGVLLTAENDSVNMGTFNYAAGIATKGAHQKYDVDPYLKWGNTKDSPQKGKAKIRESIKQVMKSYKENSEKVLEYRSKILDSVIKAAL